jgi:hypothetical protein
VRAWLPPSIALQRWWHAWSNAPPAPTVTSPDELAEIEADPELSGKLKQLAGAIDWADVGELTAWGALVWAARWLFQVADWPVTKHLSAKQNAALSDQFMVLAVIVALAAIIVTKRRN